MLDRLDQIERDTQALGRELFASLSGKMPQVFQRRWWEARFFERCTRDETAKVQLFRFIDVLPTLRTDQEVARYLQEYLLPYMPSALRYPAGLLSPRSFVGRALGRATRISMRWLAKRFIAGATVEEALAVLQRLRRRRMAFTLDVLGEATVSEEEAERYMHRYLSLLETLAPKIAGWKVIEQIDLDHRGRLPRMHVSLKLSSLSANFDPTDPEGTSRAVKARLRPILRTAQRREAFVTIDMEQYRYKDLTLRIFKELLEEEEFKNFDRVGIALQAYLKDTERDLLDLIAWGKRRGSPVTVRLVKGAYWDYEIVIARQEGWPVPVFTRKEETDANFEKLTALLLEHHDVLHPAIGSHNIRSIAHALAWARHLKVPDRTLEFQLLYGMGDPIKAALVQMGHRVRVYVPFGELIPGMGYLIRRLLENTSNESFLRRSFAKDLSPDELLKPPGPSPQPSTVGRRNGEGPIPPFRNEPILDFAREEERQRMQKALRVVRQEFGRSYPLVIGGEEVSTPRRLPSLNPSHPEEVVGWVSCADGSLAEQALEAARQAFPRWAAVPPKERADLLFRAAALLREQRGELAAWEVYEAGKPWQEADADVAEAIDYLEYYGREMLRLGTPQRLGNLPGEINEYVYQPRGVAVVIAPWNFPLAILTGMTSAALVAGNTVIMKPAEQTPVIAAKLMAILKQAGAPPGVVNYLPGIGEEVGEYLVKSPKVDLIAFTGSKAVGLRILELAAQTGAGQRGPKKVIAEMGGKNAIIVDEDADLDEAVQGVLLSAFGYAGQKCSACSRTIVLRGIYEAFLSRLVEAARSLPVGPADLPGTVVGPLIDEEAYQKVRRFIDIGRKEAKPILEVDTSSLGTGYFVGPTIFADVPPEAAIAQEEIFGPVLAVIPARDFEEALSLANGTAYALTGGLYSRSPAHIQQAKEAFQVGNLYINRKITGAKVGRQPFGGLRMSGIGSKAGGPDYLLQFLEPRVVTENTLRHGFAPLPGEE